MFHEIVNSPCSAVLRRSACRLGFPPFAVGIAFAWLESSAFYDNSAQPVKFDKIGVFAAVAEGSEAVRTGLASTGPCPEVGSRFTMSVLWY